MPTLSRLDSGEHHHSTRTDEFRYLLNLLGVTVRSDRPHNVSCWRHEDRKPSLHLTPGKAVWFCHSCGTGGGVVELLAELGLEPSRSGHLTTGSVLARLDRLAAPGADLVSLIPPPVIDEFRRVTGRHKRDTVLSSNLSRVLASIWRRATEAGHHVGVRYTVTDAVADGIHAELWHHLIGLRLTVDGRTGPLVSWLGIEVRLGECGLRCGPGFTGTGTGGAFRATEVNLSAVCEHPEPLSKGGTAVETKHGIDNTERCSQRPRRNGAAVTWVATRAASRPRGSVPTLARRRAVALLLADLGMTEAETVPGRWEVTGTRTVAELVEVYGDRIRQTISWAEFYGWVRVIREHPPVCRRDGLPRVTSGIVVLSDAGIDRLEIDTETGSAHLSARAAHRVEMWAATVDKIRLEMKQRTNEPGLDPFGDGRSVNVTTGELVTAGK